MCHDRMKLLKLHDQGKVIDHRKERRWFLGFIYEDIKKGGYFKFFLCYWTPFY